MITEAQINLLKDVIVETMQPEKIYLFGSYATGSATEESDIDILIEVKYSDLPKRKRPLELFRNIAKQTRLNADILIRTSEEIKYYHCLKNSFLTTILDESKLIYAA